MSKNAILDGLLQQKKHTFLFK